MTIDDELFISSLDVSAAKTYREHAEQCILETPMNPEHQARVLRFVQVGAALIREAKDDLFK